MKIEVSERVKNLPPYILGQLKSLVLARRQAGADIIDLNMGNPADPPPRQVVDKLREAVLDPRNSRYSTAGGVFNLRRDIALKWKRKWGVDLDPEDQVIATIGSKEGFSHLCLALLGPGDTVVVGDPAFQIHSYAVVLAGGRTIPVPLGADDAFLARIDRVLDETEPTPRAMVLNFPHNPTGITVEPSFFDQVVRIAHDRGVMVIHDFAYGETCFDGYPAPSFLQADGAADVGVEFATLSKPYNMAGWRIGLCVGNREMIAALARIKGYYDYGIFQAVQIAAIIAMREGDEHVLEQAAVYQERRDVMVEGVRSLGWDVDVPRAGMFVWARVHPDHLVRFGGRTMDFSLAMVDEAEVAMTPGAAFGPGGEGHVRMALVENRQRIRQGLRQLGRALA